MGLKNCGNISTIYRDEEGFGVIIMAQRREWKQKSIILFGFVKFEMFFKHSCEDVQ